MLNSIFPNDEIVNVNDARYVDNPIARSAIMRYLILMERISVGINIEVYDLHTFMRLTGRATINFFDRVLPVIMNERRTTGRNYLFCDFQKLAMDMKDEYSRRDPPLIADNTATIRHS